MDEDVVEHQDPQPLTRKDSSSREKHQNQVSSTLSSAAPDNNEYSQELNVPKKDRRGLLSFLVLPRERIDARTHSKGVKWFITFIVATSALIAPIGGSIFLPAMQNISDSLNTTPDIVNVSYGIYTLALGIFPLWWSALSEFYGRRNVYVISFSLFIGFTIGCALSTSIGMLMAFRILSGAAASSVQAVGAGSISDLFITTERAKAIGYYYLGPLCGPLLAPIFGGLITDRWYWQGTQWFLVILGVGTLLLVLFFLPETLRDQKRILYYNQIEAEKYSEKFGTELARHETTQSEQLAKLSPEEPKSFKQKLMRIIIHPFRTFKFFKFPPVPLAIIYSSYCFFSLYFMNIGLESLYSNSPYNFKSIIVGLMYIPNSIGYVIASLVNGRWSDYILRRSIKRNNGVEISEARIAENVYMAAALFPAALLLFGWTANARIFWLVPLIGSFLFGVASMIIFSNTMTYLVDTLPGRGSSAVALNNLLRMTLAAVATFVAEPLERAIGFGWLYTMLAIGSLFAFLSVVAIKRYGTRWRENFDLAAIY